MDTERGHATTKNPRSEGIAALLDAAAPEDDMEARSAVDAIGRALQARHVADDDIPAVADRLLGLAQHRAWEVRKEVAHALLHLRHEAYLTALPILLKDPNAYVAGAARRTQARRAELARADLLRESHERLLGRQLDRIEAEHGSRARAAALHISALQSEMIAREIYHESSRFITALRSTLGKLDVAVGRARIDPQRCRSLVGTARKRAELIDEILESMRQITKHVEPEFRGERLRAVIEEAIQLVRDEKCSGRDFAVDLQVDPELVLDAHASTLLQAFVNVIVNAVEAYDKLDREPRIRVQARVDASSRVVVTIADHGCGMSASVLAAAFELFATRKKDTGTGVGLTLTKKFIENVHGGLIRLESQPDLGTTVTIVLPIEQAQREVLP